MCYGFRLTNQNDHFESLLTTFNASVVFEADWADVEKGWLFNKSKKYSTELAENAFWTL